MAMNHKVELLAPAGNFEKLQIAIHYGADAVYLAGKEFSLRNFSENFTIDELKQAVTTSHDSGVKEFVTDVESPVSLLMHVHQGLLDNGNDWELVFENLDSAFDAFPDFIVRFSPD